MKTIFKKFGQYSLKGVLLPDGRFMPDFVDATRILATILGASQEALDRMPEVDSPLDAAGGFWMLLNETKDRPETIVFKDWLDSLTQGEKGYSDTTVIDMFRHFGRKVTQDEILQSMMDSPDTVVVTDDEGTRMYSKDGDLLAGSRKL